MDNKESYKKKYNAQLETLETDVEKIKDQSLEASADIWESIKKRLEIAWYSLKATYTK